MTELQKHQDLCRQFAILLSYPARGVEQTAAGCAALLEQMGSSAAGPLKSFVSFLAENDAARIEEVFTSTFDLQALCHPYVGYQLFGESQQRTLFMIQLQQIYRQYEFNPGHELPDHLSEVLRFVGFIDDQGARQEIIQDGLLPALEKILQGIDNQAHPYAQLIAALQSFLTENLDAGSELLAASR